MSPMSPELLCAGAASLAAGAALLEVARIPVRIGRPHRGPSRAHPEAGGSGRRARPRWTSVSGTDRRVEAALDAAGRTAVPDAAALATRGRVGGLVGGAWGGAVALMMLPPVLALLVAVGGALGGRALPLVLLRRAGRQRAARLRDETPELLELLAVALGCGLPIRAALEAAGRWSVGELSDGVRRAATELGRGAGTGPTLERLLRDHPTVELEGALAILDRSRAHGTPASGPLRALAVGARHARARRAMEHAARAAPRVQLVAALLLVPAALCVLAASLVAGGVG